MSPTDIRVTSIIDTVLVKIIVTDVNDNRPKWKAYKKEIALTKQLPTASFLTSVEAQDKDTGNNGKLKYSIVSGNQGTFLGINSRYMVEIFERGEGGRVGVRLYW